METTLKNAIISSKREYARMLLEDITYSPNTMNDDFWWIAQHDYNLRDDEKEQFMKSITAFENKDIEEMKSYIR